MRRAGALLLAWLLPAAAQACPTCVAPAGPGRAAWLGATAFLLLMPLALIGGLLAWLARASAAQSTDNSQDGSPMRPDAKGLLRGPLGLAFAAAAMLLGCEYRPPEKFASSVVLAGQGVDAATLNRGQMAFGYYCRACHGDAGDGRGPAAAGLRTPPRDLRTASYKFTAVVDGLPRDEDLARVVRAGLHGTAMLEWDIPEAVLADVVQYVKTFSPPGDGWRDPSAELGRPVEPGDDPWEGRLPEAVARGRAVYHGTASCQSCHPAYLSQDEIDVVRSELGLAATGAAREKPWLPEPKRSDTYTMPRPDDPACASEADCPGDDVTCRYGRCETKHSPLPPDFTVNELRISTTPADAYRIIAAGIPGTAMPTWDGALAREDIWAMAHYVRWLVENARTEEVAALKARARTANGPG